MEAIQQAIINGVIGLLVTVITILMSGAKEYLLAKSEELRAKKSSTEWDMIQSIGVTVVTAVEQIAKTLEFSPQDKLMKAIELLDVELNKYGIDLTDENKRTVIESSVKSMNELNELVLDTVTK